MPCAPCPYPLDLRKDYKKVPKASRGASALSYIIPQPFVGTDKTFCAQRHDHQCVDSAECHHCTFVNLGFKGTRFRNSQFLNCIFVNCYFRRSDFSNCTFTGCWFIDCNFDHVALKGCSFQYSRFRNCQIPYSEMEFSLPRTYGKTCAAISPLNLDVWVCHDKLVPLGLQRLRPTKNTYGPLSGADLNGTRTTFGPSDGLRPYSDLLPVASIGGYGVMDSNHSGLQSRKSHSPFWYFQEFSIFC